MQEHQGGKGLSMELKKLLAANMLFNGIAAALAVIVPLYLIDRKVDMGVIGLILAIGPFTFMVMRIFFASVADSIGTKIISVFYSVSNIVAVLLYLISTSLTGISIAMFIESLRTSAFWAVNRTEVLNESRKSSDVMAFFSGMRQLADALGRLGGGLLIAYLAFQNSFMALAAASVILLIIILSYRKGNIRSPSIDGGVINRIFKKHPPTFWHSALLLTLIIFLPNMFLAFVIPVYAHAGLGFGYSETGGLVALFSFVMAIATLVSSRWHFNMRTLLLVVLLSVPALLLLPFMGKDIAFPLLAVAVACGCSGIIAEYLLVDQTYRSKDVSTDIGVLFVPLKALETVFLSIGGFVIANFGYLPIFVFMAFTMALLFILGRNALKGHAQDSYHMAGD